MDFRGFLILLLCVQLGAAANTGMAERHDPTISECAARGGECDETRGRPVCGTDDQTYPSRCHLLRVQCSGHQVSLKYRGPCKACKEAREYALKHRTKTPPKFIPRCKPDGTYAAVQCLVDTGCWCSDFTGRPIEKTSVRTGKPNCREFKRNNMRRSPPRHLDPSNRIRRNCNQEDRSTFNSNLLQVFQSEYIRAGQHQRDGASVTFVPPADNLVLDWKFAHLDTNANQMLDKNEFRELKKLVKRAVKPRRCGRAFGKFCDIDDDDRLTRNEWNSCIFKEDLNRKSEVNHGYTAAGPHGYIHQNNNNNNNINNRPIVSQNHHQIPSNNNQNTIHSISSNNRHMHGSVLDDLASGSVGDDEESTQHLDYDDDADYNPEDSEADDGDNLSIIKPFGSSTNFPSIYFLRPKPESPLKESESESDCLADRNQALEEQRQLSTVLYVPECTPDGRYQKVQCYQPTPYCWCVNEDTGKNIPGTSAKDKRPQCDTVSSISRPMKGCPEPKKTTFLKNLKQFLKMQLLSNTNAGSNITNWSSEDERIATLSFVIIDKNKNKAWERKEWKVFRELMANSKTLRKCGKKMPRYCDANSDKKITLSEWLNCLQQQTEKTEVEAVEKTPSQTNTTVTAKPLKLTGYNPLEQYLKD